MKKVVLIATLLFAAIITYAADVIVLTDGTKIDAKILEVSNTEIRYKEIDNLDGPTFVQETQKIAVVIYESGKTKIYNNNQSADNQQQSQQDEKKEGNHKSKSKQKDTEKQDTADDGTYKWSPFPKDNRWFGLTFGYASYSQKAVGSGAKGSFIGGQTDKVSPGVMFGLLFHPTFKYGLGLRTGAFMYYSYEKFSFTSYTTENDTYRYKDAYGHYRTGVTTKAVEKNYNVEGHDITLTVPIQLSYRICLWKDFSALIYTGPVISFGAFGKLEGYSDSDYYSKDSYSGFNMLWGIGGGLQYKFLRLDVGGEFGMMKKSNSSVKWNRPVYVGLSFMF